MMSKKMMMLVRILRSGFVNFFRNLWLSTAATAIMLVTLTILLVGLILNMVLSSEIDEIVSDITVSVYFLPASDESLRQQLKSDLESNENVREVNFVSEDEALRIFREQNEDDPELLEGLTIAENALPASFEVKVFDLEKIDPLIAISEDQKYASIVEETSYDSDREERIQKIASAQQFITRSSLIAGAIFAGISVLIIFNTIRMAIFTRGEEIRIMQLIGATNAYIRGPFIFESALYGIVAGLASLILVYSTLAGLGTELNERILIQPTIDFFFSNWLVVGLATITIGITIGIVSSMLAMVRYLKI